MKKASFLFVSLVLSVVAAFATSTSRSDESTLQLLKGYRQWTPVGPLQVALQPVLESFPVAV